MTQRIEIVRGLFEERTHEVKLHLGLISELINKKANRIARLGPDGKVELFDYEIERDTLKMLIASGFLHIYNLVESTMTNSIDAIHIQFQSDQTKFEELTEQLKKICIKNFKKASAPEIYSYEHPISTAMLKLGYEKKALFSGNIHANTIKDKAKEYGFSIGKHDKSKSKNGDRLEIVMTRRNDLAHGNISFQQCGSEASIDELTEILEESVLYLTAVIDGIEEYLRQKGYNIATTQLS